MSFFMNEKIDLKYIFLCLTTFVNELYGFITVLFLKNKNWNNNWKKSLNIYNNIIF